jgi:hypothetical protein
MCAEVLLFQRRAFWVLGFRRLCFFLELVINDSIQVVVEIWKCIFVSCFLWALDLSSRDHQFMHFEDCQGICTL